MNDTKIASKAKAQLSNFMGKVFTHFSKPTRRFIEECIYGIQASGDTKLSSIVRAIDDDIKRYGECWYYIACSPEKGMVPGVERLPCIRV